MRRWEIWLKTNTQQKYSKMCRNMRFNYIPLYVLTITYEQVVRKGPGGIQLTCCQWLYRSNNLIKMNKLNLFRQFAPHFLGQR